MKKVLTILLGLALILLFSASFEFAKGKKTIWTIPGNFATIQDAIDSPDVENGHTIFVYSGYHAGAFINKGVIIKGIGHAVINTGPLHPAGLSMGFRLFAGSDDAVFQNLEFEVDLAIMNGGAVDFVTVDHCIFRNTIQAVSNWRGSFWQITHNEIIDLRTRNGGGIGILVADYTGGIVESNYIAHNKIYGTVHVDPGDGGGYCASGIVIYADFRWGGAGALEIKDNKVIKNKVGLVSDTPLVVDVWAFELTDTRDDPALIVIFENAIGFNDFRNTTNHIALTPLELEDYNSISRNLGNKRGGGLHPRIFFK